MSSYKGVYEKQFVRNLQRYAALKDRIEKKVESLLDNPYQNTEALADAAGRLNLKGCRSARIDRNFRIVFVICEECRTVPDCGFCFCKGLSDDIVFLLRNSLGNSPGDCCRLRQYFRQELFLSRTTIPLFF